MADKSAAAARLLLTVEDADGTELMNLDGGYVYADGGRCAPTHAIISAPDGEKWRAVCKMKSHDTWSWTLQTARAALGGAADGSESDHDCSVCWSPFFQPTRFPASEDAAHCEHVFCRECIVRCLSSGQNMCPLCRAPLAEGMTALKAKSLPIDGATADACVTIFACPPISINFVSGNPATVWTHSSEGTAQGPAPSTLPRAISVKATAGRILAWSGKTAPKSAKGVAAIPEADRASLLGVVSTAVRSAARSGLTAVREVEVNVKPELLSTASKAELAIFLAILTESFWSRGGHGNVHVAQNPWGGPREF